MSSSPVYVPLWCRSVFSFLRGASFPDELMQQAQEYNLPAVALTDVDSLAGVVHGEVERRRLAETGHAADLICGSEVSLVGGGRIVLLAQDREGYGNISELISRGRQRSPKGESSVLWEEVLHFHQGVILLWTWRSGEAAHIEPVRDTFQDRLYLGITRRKANGDVQREHALRDLAQRYALPLVALPRVTFHQPQRRRLRDVLIAIRHNTTLEEAGRLLTPNALEALPAPEVAQALYRDEPELLTTTLAIAERCSFKLEELQYRYPEEGSRDAQGTPVELHALTMEGAQRRYPQGIPGDVQQQLAHELALIGELDYGGYFLTMARIVTFCREQGIICQGRGSAANSVVCYCLGITAIDPVRMNLLFERFISRERAEPPDIDLDIEHRRREEVIQHVYQRYGRDRAAMVANTVRFRRRSAVRQVGGVFGVPEMDLERIVQLMGDRGLDPGEAIRMVAEEMDEPRRELFEEMVTQIIGVPRHLSIHPGGFLLGNEPIARIVPVENATMPGRTVIQWDKYSLEEMNLFKVDLLGLGALTHLDYAFRLLTEHEGIELSLATIPPGCPSTYAMLQKGDTVGVFQLESRAQMAMLPRLKPTTFYDLVVEISLVRPGPITGGMVHPYLRRRAGEEDVVYPHPRLRPILERTLGVPLFQEQVMKLAMTAADYTPGEADQLRRDMAAWRQSGRIEAHRERITQRMIDQGIDPAFARQVFEQIRGFGEYGFPESHAAGFALIAYATAWLRCHYPAVFTCALLNAWPMGFYTPATIVQDARRQGLVVRPVDCTYSEWHCTLEDDGTGGARAIRMGFRFVRGIGQQDWQRIDQARKEIPFTLRRDTAARYLRELIQRSRVDRAVIGAIVQAGAFDRVGYDRRHGLWDSLGISGGEANRGEADLLTSQDVDEGQPVPDWARTEREERVHWDYRVARHSTTAHPMELYRPALEAQRIPTAEQIRQKEHGAPITAVGLVICRQRPATAGGTVFMTLEDETGFINLVIWEKTFTALRHILLSATFLYVQGTLQVAGPVVHLIMRDARIPEGMT